MSLSVEAKAKIVSEFGRGENDSGSYRSSGCTADRTDQPPAGPLCRAQKKITTAVVVCCAWFLSVVNCSTT